MADYKHMSPQIDLEARVFTPGEKFLVMVIRANLAYIKVT